MEDWIGIVVFLAIGILSVVSRARKAAKEIDNEGVPDALPRGEPSGHWSEETEGEVLGETVYLSDNKAVMGEGRGEFRGEAGYVFGRDHNAETAPRRAVSAGSASASSAGADFTDVNSVVADSGVVFESDSFDLRRAVIEAEILTPKYL